MVVFSSYSPTKMFSKMSFLFMKANIINQKFAYNL